MRLASATRFCFPWLHSVGARVVFTWHRGETRKTCYAVYEPVLYSWMWIIPLWIQYVTIRCAMKVVLLTNGKQLLKHLHQVHLGAVKFTLKWSNWLSYKEWWRAPTPTHTHPAASRWRSCVFSYLNYIVLIKTAFWTWCSCLTHPLLISFKQMSSVQSLSWEFSTVKLLCSSFLQTCTCSLPFFFFFGVMQPCRLVSTCRRHFLFTVTL